MSLLSHTALQIADSALLHQILTKFPKKCNYAFAYGSAVFAQDGQKKPGKMIDLIFVVDKPVAWHRENLKMNRHHYSGLKYFGPRLISIIQERMASGVYYNPFVAVDGQLLKYGVISTAALERDLIHWNKIYIAGRLHKPVLDLHTPGSSNLVSAMRLNRESATRAVLLQEGRCFPKFTLYHGITELSYLGDSRMKIAENPDKAKNIVVPIMKEFDALYLPILDGLSPMTKINSDGFVIQNITPQDRFEHLMALPIQIQVNLVRQMFRDPRLCDIEDVMGEMSYLPSLRNLIKNSITDVVWGSSIRQTIQGLLTAGVSRSVKYALEKLKKGREGRNNQKENQSSSS